MENPKAKAVVLVLENSKAKAVALMSENPKAKGKAWYWERAMPTVLRVVTVVMSVVTH